ncbi:Fur family transcriptional regulator [Bartonella sp. LJL80]
MADKLTRNQGLVLSILENEKAPLSAYTILDRLRSEGFRAPLQVYRALEKLIEAKRVHRLESVNAFMACTHPDHCDHGLTAFAICDVCGEATEIESHALAHNIDKIADGIGFTPRQSMIEIRGTCARCANK